MTCRSPPCIYKDSLSGPSHSQFITAQDTGQPVGWRIKGVSVDTQVRRQFQAEHWCNTSTRDSRQFRQTTEPHTPHKDEEHRRNLASKCSRQRQVRKQFFRPGSEKFVVVTTIAKGYNPSFFKPAKPSENTSKPANKVEKCSHTKTDAAILVSSRLRSTGENRSPGHALTQLPYTLESNPGGGKNRALGNHCTHTTKTQVAGCMDRQRRTTAKDINYRKFHLSGDLEQVVQGKVSGTVQLLEKEIMEGPPSISEDATPEQLQEMIKERQENSARLQQQAETMKLRNQLEAEIKQQEQWKLAIQQLKQARENQAQEHERNLEKMKTMAQEKARHPKDQAVAWLQTQLSSTSLTGAEATNGTHTTPPMEEEDSQRSTLLQQLLKQQEDLQKQIEEASKENAATAFFRQPPAGIPESSRNQGLLLEQAKVALAPKSVDTEPNRALLKALLSAQNKTTGTGGTSTLRPEVYNKITGDREFSMADWLASLNRQEEGESEVNKILSRLDDEFDCRTDCRHNKTKSGMLNKSTTNIRHKEVWPQKNLGEDWAEEEIEFKQLKFEHLVAGETRTIETCTDPAQILGRLRLLRRLAYLKLRGIEWYLLRKMYAAILSSIETGEYSWESNFDQFESILYRRVLTDRISEKEHRPPQEGRKRYCKDFNKSDGCPKTSPHIAWLGTGPTATKRLVYHCCATCSVKDRVARDHPEGHPDCPHRA